jgi:predicted Fe-Mo cluster-binding NifX family protein
MSRKILITLNENDVAPRFDLATEVLITTLTEEGAVEEKTLVLAHPSAEDLCQLILNEGIQVVVCGGIEEEFYEYLSWKKVEVVDCVMGPWERALELLNEKRLEPGAILFDRSRRKTHAH